ncbi:MAG: terminase small subunit, partial [Gammaproteobacteria bacterium]
GDRKLQWKDRAHFLAIAARSMRQILVERARARHAQKRGGVQRAVTLEDKMLGQDQKEQAAIRAKYSERSAEVQASQLLRNPKVFAVVEAGQKRLAELVKVQQYEIVRELRKIAFSNMCMYLSWGPDGVKLTDSEALTPEQAACVAEVSEQITESSRHVKFKLHNKIDALNSLAKHLGMFPSKVEQPKEVQPVQFNIVLNPTDKHDGESRRRVVKDVPAR